MGERLTAGWLAAGFLAFLAGVGAGLLPSRLDPRLRCVAAYEATVGLWDPARVPRAAALGRDPWGRPFVPQHSDVWRCACMHVATPVWSLGPDGVPSGDDVPLPWPDSTCVQLGQALPVLLGAIGLGLWAAAWAVWTTTGSRARVPVLLVVTCLTSVVGGGLVLRVFEALGLEPPRTPVAGPLAPFLSCWGAALLGAVAVARARSQRDRARGSF